jgi:hypothetical protein
MRNDKSQSKKQYSGKGYSAKKNFSSKKSSSNIRQTGKYIPEKYDTTAPGSNDPAWYGAMAELLRDSASIPYSWAVGTPVDLNIDLLPSTSRVTKFAVPGIQAIKLLPSVGRSTDAVSPINVASNATYAFIRHANSGHSNYDAPDLMLYILAMSQVYSYIVFLQRAYGCATLYAQKNRYIPEALLKAMNINASDIQSHLADFRYGINVLINKAASFAVPNDMTYFQRQAFLYSNVYSEGSSIKDQLYMYTPGGFWQYGWDSVNSAGKLSMKLFNKNITTTGYTVDDLLTFGNEMLNALIYDEDVNIMSGDILKAYGSDKIIKLAPLTTEFPILPVFNLEVLEQMKNATIVGGGLRDGWAYDYLVTQDPTHGWLLHNPSMTITNADGTTAWIQDAAQKTIKGLVSNRLISTSVNEVTPEVTMENTRLTAGATNYVYTAGTKATVSLITGSEFACGVEFIRFTVDTDPTTGVDVTTYLATALRYAYPYAVGAAVAPTWGVQEMYKITVGSNFKFHPLTLIPGVKQATDTTKAEIIDWEIPIFQDVDNYAVVTTQDLQRMHEAALFNELHVPFIAKVSQ